MGCPKDQSNKVGHAVTFLDARGARVTRTVIDAIQHCAADCSSYPCCCDPEGLDYTVLLFYADLPASVSVASYVPDHAAYPCHSYFGVVPLRNVISANAPPFDTSSVCALGDSGSPFFIPMADGRLVLTEACSTDNDWSRIQKDMDTLSVRNSLSPAPQLIYAW